MNCRNCHSLIYHEFLNLGFSPLSNSFLTLDELLNPELYYPLKVLICHHCFLVQLDEYASHEKIFNNDYAYFSSYSKSWLDHCKEYVDKIIEKLSLNNNSRVIEIASNDGYLLQFFLRKNISVLGIEPTANTAAEAIKKGIRTIVDFFGTEKAQDLASDGIKANLIIGNNVLAHVPNINDFVGGLKFILDEEGVVTMEFPHLLQLLHQNQFDTIYHEHYSYLSLTVVNTIFKANQLAIFEVEELKTHGGSLRIYACHQAKIASKLTGSVQEIIEKENKFGLGKLETYQSFQSKVDHIKNKFLNLLIGWNFEGKKVVAYGAAAKGNTMLNYCGVRTDLLHFIADASPYKQNKYSPGMHIPVATEDELKKYKPDYIIILPWNLKDEISHQLSYVREWNCKFVTAIPEIEIF